MIIYSYKDDCDYTAWLHTYQLAAFPVTRSVCGSIIFDGELYFWLTMISEQKESTQQLKMLL